jgi:anaerobic selenocysteine-containing dehydrogenase
MLAEMAEVTQTHCPYCSLQCGIHLTARDDGVLDLEGRRTSR